MIWFGALGAAGITPRALVQPCWDEPRAAIRCIAARDRRRAEGFAEWFRIPVVHDGYADVVTDEAIGVVYNALPISGHREWTLRALAAGKHVLCEKSLACNAKEAEDMARAAKEAGLVLMEAFHYRYHPVFVRAKAVVDSGALGEMREIEAVFNAPVTNPADIRNNYATGGGSTMDLGCYPISWVRHITGEEPEEVEARAEVGAPHVDVMLEAKMRFPGGATATTSSDMRAGVNMRMELKVTGDRGAMTVVQPLVPQIGHSITITSGGATTVEKLDRRSTYSYQLDAFLDAVEEGKPLLTDAEDAVKQMRLIDRCYESAGLPVRGLDL